MEVLAPVRFEQLAHLALVLIGEGKCFIKAESTRRVQDLGFKPISVELHEGLALMMASVMTGIGIVNAIYKRLLNWMTSCSAAINEIVKAYDDHCLSS
ncbi:aromatic amino acid lyase [Xanthomarina gelatinilytica]|uniref:aromatic amino acid lyase n=1 Tax=Xanthomarina gelatinilytica TaxID=1137281 RepID=UPI003AA7F5A8